MRAPGILLLLLLLVAGATFWPRIPPLLPLPTPAGDPAACFATQRTLAAALEAHAAATGGRLQRLDAGTLRTLLDGGHLREVPRDPGYGPGSDLHFVAHTASARGVLCLLHGAEALTRELDPYTRERGEFLRRYLVHP